MTREEINLNESVQIRLTESGANYLNNWHKARNAELDEWFGSEDLGGRYKTDYIEGDVYENQLWLIINIFADRIGMGIDIPFEGPSIKILKN